MQLQLLQENPINAFFDDWDDTSIPTIAARLAMTRWSVRTRVSSALDRATAFP
jgi:hypothetical protein